MFRRAPSVKWEYAYERQDAGHNCAGLRSAGIRARPRKSGCSRPSRRVLHAKARQRSSHATVSFRGTIPPALLKARRRHRQPRRKVLPQRIVTSVASAGDELAPSFQRALQARRALAASVAPAATMAAPVTKAAVSAPAPPAAAATSVSFSDEHCLSPTPPSLQGSGGGAPRRGDPQHQGVTFSSSTGSPCTHNDGRSLKSISIRIRPSPARSNIEGSALGHRRSDGDQSQAPIDAMLLFPRHRQPTTRIESCPG